MILLAASLLLPSSTALASVDKTEATMVVRAEKEASLDERFKFLKDKEVLKGKAQLQRDLTKAELAVSLYRLFKLDEVKKNSQLSDVKKHWAKKEIQAVMAKGWMKADKKGKFSPNKKVTIEELALVLSLTAELDTDKYASIWFPANNWAQGYLAAVLTEGLLGKEENYREVAKRSHLVYSLYELYHFKSKSGGIVAGTLEPKANIQKIKEGEYQWTFLVKNQTEKEQTVNISGSKFDYILKKDGQKVEQFTDGKHFIMLYQEIVLKQGEELTFSGYLQGLKKGKYELELWLIDRNWPDAKTTLKFEVE